MEFEKLTKYSAPTKYDKAPYLTQWYNLKEEGHTEIYLQLSKDEENPHWERFGTFLENAFMEFLNNAAFIEECCRLYEYKKYNPFTAISHIIKDSAN